MLDNSCSALVTQREAQSVRLSVEDEENPFVPVGGHFDESNVTYELNSIYILIHLITDPLEIGTVHP